MRSTGGDGERREQRCGEPRGALSRSCRGQAWGLDYTLGLLLFIFTVLLVLGVLLRTVLVRDAFSDVVRSADAVSEQLMTPGYPSSWRAADVITAGLLTENELSQRKAERLAAMADADYNGAKNILNTKYGYSITLLERNSSLIPIGAWCRIGAGTEQKSVANVARASAYYGDGGLKSLVASHNGSLYGAEDLPLLMESLRSYDLIILEEPNLATAARPYDAQKASMLQEAVLRGATLLLVGNVNLTELFALNITAINATDNATGTSANDTLLNLSGATVDNVAGFALTQNGQERYEPLATLPDGRDYAARFTYGDGDVYYLGGLTGTLTATGETLLNHVLASLDQAFSTQLANCSAVSIPSQDVRNLVQVRRLIAFQGRMVLMKVNIWESR